MKEQRLFRRIVVSCLIQTVTAKNFITTTVGGTQEKYEKNGKLQKIEEIGPSIIQSGAGMHFDLFLQKRSISAALLL